MAECGRRMTIDISGKHDLGESDNTSSMHTSVSSMTDIEALVKPLKQLDQEKDYGKYLQINENGWVEHKEVFDQISPNNAMTNQFVKRRRSSNLNVVKAVQSGIMKLDLKKDSFRALNATQKLKQEKQPELAAYALALDSEREMERSQLVPMAPQYKQIANYLKTSNEKEKIRRVKIQAAQTIEVRRMSAVSKKDEDSSDLASMMEVKITATPTGGSVRKARPQSVFAGSSRKAADK